ncbi:MAG TPA: glutamine--fructose-6-phosphate transaminase (isomerizing) [Polyangiaceae bacterium]|jgi:glucosamine--fructose-6-phosphate aminotransferase (isomerizing)|nr:glutamine--fructose-6-phosphate transaminase (isomerizing) [Polyangiaceae bacterium]
MNEESGMCGIFGYVGSRADAAQIVLEGLRKLEYRGYDSWGIAVAGEARAVVERRVGKIGRASTILPSSRAALGHTRWATHGGVTEGNAHPHLDCTGRLAIVHNGIVANDVELRRTLSLAGHELRSQTDTELIAHRIEDALKDAPPGPRALLDATLTAFRSLRGLNAIAVLDVRSGTLAAAKTGSPLVIGFGRDGQFLASDAAALLEHTRSVAFVGEGQAVLLDGDRARLFDLATGTESAPAITTVTWEAESADRGEHPDFMTKEMHEQPALLARLARADEPRALAALVEGSDEVFMLGCGSAAHAAICAQYLFARAGRRLTVATGSEFGHLLPLVNARSLVVVLSQSGETIDVLDAARAARARGARIAALTNVEGSSLWRMADFTVPLRAGPERCVLATKSLTAKLALVYLTARALGGESWAEGGVAVERAAHDIALMLTGPRRATLCAIAEAVASREHLFVLGRGASYPLALETALKIKEVSYIHAEGFAAGELKHGVMALIEPGTPCIVIAPGDDTQADVMAAAMQVKARGALVIGVSPRSHEVFDHHVEVADLGDATAIVNAVPAQILGYELARLRGHDPDMPRNLAKSVTVK